MKPICKVPKGEKIDSFKPYTLDSRTSKPIRKKPPNKVIKKLNRWKIWMVFNEKPEKELKTKYLCKHAHISRPTLMEHLNGEGGLISIGAVKRIKNGLYKSIPISSIPSVAGELMNVTPIERILNQVKDMKIKSVISGDPKISVITTHYFTSPKGARKWVYNIQGETPLGITVLNHLINLLNQNKWMLKDMPEKIMISFLIDKKRLKKYLA